MTYQKLFRLAQPNNDITEQMMQIYSDKTRVYLI